MMRRQIESILKEGQKLSKSALSALQPYVPG